MIVFEKIILWTIMLTIVNEGSLLTIVNEGLSLTIINKGLSFKIVNKTTNFIKTVVFGKSIVFEKKKCHAALLNVVLHKVLQLWGS